jgi:hypothetical protein
MPLNCLTAAASLVGETFELLVDETFGTTRREPDSPSIGLARVRVSSTGGLTSMGGS